MRAYLAGVIALLVPSIAPAEWIRVSSPGIEVLTDAGDKTGRRVLARFEQIHNIFHAANVADSPLTVRVFAFASEQEFHLYSTGPAAHGFYQSGRERDYIVLHTGPMAERAAFHEYVHLILNHSAVPLPKWFEEGTAEFYSTLEIERGRLWVGKPIESHVALLSTGKWLTAEQLTSVTATSPFYTERERVGIFYAQNWALVHMLNLAPRWRDGMPEFALLLAEGRKPEAAFESAFGKTVGEAFSILREYLRSLRAVSIPASETEAASESDVERMTATGAVLARADLALQVDRRELARKLLEQSAREKPESPEVAAGLGTLALVENRSDEARRHLERAIALGSREAATYFEYAMLERDTGAKRGRVDQLLRKVIAVNPNFAEAHFLLGVRWTDDGRYSESIEHLREAVRILPRQSYFWHALGYAQWKLGRREEARESARRAVATAESISESDMAAALVSLVQGKVETTAPLPKRAAVITPRSWENARGDAKVDGVLTKVDCEGSSARLHIRAADGKLVILETHHPSEVELVHTPQAAHELACGSQNARVIVEYVSATREITRIEFRP